MVACLLLSVCHLQSQPADTARLEALSAARSDLAAIHGENYVQPKTEKLRALERIGINSLGNPWREWYFPSGSADCMIWIINWYSDKGSLVKQSKKGKYTVVDWVLDLDYKPNEYGPRPKGTLALILWNLGYEVAEQTTNAQRELLGAVQGYAGYVDQRSPADDDFYSWYVFPDGRLLPYVGGWLNCDSYPVTQEEAAAMGIQTFDGWQPLGTRLNRYWPQTWTSRPYGTVPGREERR